MNTGLAFHKPYESAYSRYRRFLIANQGLYSTAGALRKGLKKQLKEFGSKYNVDEFSTSNMALFYEKEFIKKNRLKLNIEHRALKDGYRPKRHCPICTASIYHNDIFDLPWVKKCPIHSVNLETKCLKCNSSLPSPGELVKYKCNKCGTNFKITSIVGNNYIGGNNQFNTFKHFLKILHMNATTFKSFYPDTDKHYELNTRISFNKNSPFYPSIYLAKSKNNKTVTKNQLNLLGLNFYEVNSNLYNLEQLVPNLFETNYHENEEIRKLEKICKEVNESINNRIQFTLQKKMPKNHNLGSCFQKGNEKNICIPCKVNLAWGYTRRKPNVLFGNENLYAYLNRLHHITHKNTLFITPRVIRRIYCNDKLFRIPMEMSKYLYEIDLWTTFLSLYNVVYSIHQAIKLGKTSIIEIQKHAVQYYKAIPTVPLYIEWVGSKTIKTYIPSILSKDILEDSSLTSLLYTI